MTADELLSLGPELAVYLDEFRDCFGRSEPRGKLATYVRGQLSELPRQSVEPIALAAGMRPRTLQEFLAGDEWDEARLQQALEDGQIGITACYEIGRVPEAEQAGLGRPCEIVYRDCGWMVRLHLGSVGDRSSRLAMG